MKLLGWMHRKFRQNSGEVFKEFPTGSTCNCLSGGRSLDDHHQLSPVLPARLHGRSLREQHLSADATLFFEGLLSIGTLGSDPIEEAEQEAELQESAIAVEEIAEKEENEEATETDLMVVNTELEKVLTEAAEKEGESRMSSARPSHVSGGGKANEACPLQEYLFGSAAEGVEEKERRDKRASLGELFMIEEGGSGKESGGGEETSKIKKGDDDGRGVNNTMMKKMFKKSRSSGNSKWVAGGGGAAAATSTVQNAATSTAKLQKFLQIFHKKIHPENDSKKPPKSSKYKGKYTTSGSGSNCLVANGGNSLMTSSKRTRSREHWIKTDADYLVLEL